MSIYKTNKQYAATKSLRLLIIQRKHKSSHGQQILVSSFPSSTISMSLDTGQTNSMNIPWISPFFWYLASWIFYFLPLYFLWYNQLTYTLFFELCIITPNIWFCLTYSIGTIVMDLVWYKNTDIIDAFYLKVICSHSMYKSQIKLNKSVFMLNVTF